MIVYFPKSLKRIWAKISDALNADDAIDAPRTADEIGQRDSPFIIKKSVTSKIVNHLGLALAFMMITSMFMAVDALAVWWTVGTLVLLILITLYHISRRLDNNAVIRISEEGLTFEMYGFNKWNDIESLTCIREKDEEDSAPGPGPEYLVQTLKNGRQYKINVEGLAISSSQLFLLLRRCHERFG